MTERDLTSRVLKRLREIPYSYWFKIHGGPMQQAGIPDIIGCWKGEFISFELKMPGKKLTKVQELSKQSIDSALGFCYIIHTLDELESVLKVHE